MSFSNVSHKVSLGTKLQKSQNAYVPPHDPDLIFNKIVNPKNTDPEKTIYSINVDKFLKVIKNDTLSELYRITLACRPVQQTSGMWDTVFNATRHRNITGCVFVAQKGYLPVPKHRVKSHSQFLDLSQPTTRTHLNKVEEGDVIGIGLSDSVHGFTYVILYDVEDIVSVRVVDTNDEQPRLIPGVNVVARHILRLDHSDPDETSVLNMDETPYDHGNAAPFVQRIVNSVYDINTSYPWKPHFLPIQPSSYDRTVIEERLLLQMNDAETVSYEEFENLARSLYREAARNRPPRDTNPPPQQGKRRGRVRPRPVEVPMIEVMSLNDGRFFVNLPNHDKMVAFTKDDMDNDAIAETYLTNKDLENKLVSESTLVMILSNGSFGDDAYVRYLTVNF